MKKLTFGELCTRCDTHNADKHITSQWSDPKPLTCRVVFKASNWPGKEYDEESLTYEFRSDEKYFVPGMCGNSIFANCLDGIDRNIRLDDYLKEWEIDYCYIVGE